MKLNYAEPELGLVVNYGYLWAAESMRGLENGLKDRPCVIVDIKTCPLGHMRCISVMPITHASQFNDLHSCPIPGKTQAAFGLGRRGDVRGLR